MSNIKVTGKITTANDKVNTLIANTLRSQRYNFLDIPTDCPQRDERLGWTGDVAIFAKTTCYHMALYKELTKRTGNNSWFHSLLFSQAQNCSTSGY